MTCLACSCCCHSRGLLLCKGGGMNTSSSVQVGVMSASTAPPYHRTEASAAARPPQQPRQREDAARWEQRLRAAEARLQLMRIERSEMHAQTAWSPQRAVPEGPGHTYNSVSVAAAFPSQSADAASAIDDADHVVRTPERELAHAGTMPNAWETPGGTQMALAAGNRRTPARSSSRRAESGTNQGSTGVRLRPWTAQSGTALQQPRPLLSDPSCTPRPTSASQRPRSGKPVGVSCVPARLHGVHTAKSELPCQGPHKSVPQIGPPACSGQQARLPSSTAADQSWLSRKTELPQQMTLVPGGTATAPGGTQADSVSQPLSTNHQNGGHGQMSSFARGASAASGGRTPRSAAQGCPQSQVTSAISASSRRAARSLTPDARTSFAGALGDAAHVLEDELSSRRRRSLSSRGERSDSANGGLLGCASASSPAAVRGTPAADQTRPALGLLDLATMELPSDRSSMM
jgi:hypothetical protein